MIRTCLVAVGLVAASVGCAPSPQGTAPPPDGWANAAPTVVAQVVERPDAQLLLVRQDQLQTWIEVPPVGARVGEYVLLGRGTVRTDVAIPELSQTVAAVVDITHIQRVDEETATRTIRAAAPADAVPIGTVYGELDRRAGKRVVVHGTVVKATAVAGAVWVHLQDGTGDRSAGTHDLTIKAQHPVTTGQRVTYAGVLKADVDVGFGYHFDALVEDAVRVP